MVAPAEITWIRLPNAAPTLDEVEKHLDEKQIKEGRDALKLFLCDYFGSDNSDCIKKRDRAISPLGALGSRKHLKVRWAVPGQGKRGGLRLAVAVQCSTKIVWLAGAWIRKEDPADAELDTAFSKVPSSK